jgi:sulfite reductase (NADPH) flavoprotein alpha-component
MAPFRHSLARTIKAGLHQVHSIAGLVLASLMIVIAMTGAIMSFEDEILDRLNTALMHVPPRATPVLMPDELLARLAAGGVAGKVTALKLSRDPSAAVHVRFARDGQGGRPGSLYVDPYDAGVLGSPRGEAFFATVRQLHRWLLIPGDAKGWGRQATGIVALGLIVMLLSGLVLLWPRRGGSLKIWLKPNLASGGRALHRSLHAVIGTWVLPIYLVMTLTGLWYSFDWYRDGVTWLLARPQPMATSKDPKMPRAASAGQPSQAGFDRAWSTFQQEEGGRYSRALLTMQQGNFIRIRSWQADAELETTRDEFRIDATTGHLISADRYADKTLGEKIIANILDIHRGAILGWPGQLAFMVAAALMPLFAVTGLLLYLSRRGLRRRVASPSGRLTQGA